MEQHVVETSAPRQAEAQSPGPVASSRLPQTPPRGSERRRHWLQLYCRVLIVLHLLFLYALSIGPLFWWWFDAQYIDGSPLLKAFYQPLLWACQFKPIGDAVNWYINLWIL